MNPFISIAFDSALLAMLIVLTSEPASPKPAAADIAKADPAARIQGTWKVVGQEAEGTQAPAEIVAALKLNLKDDIFRFESGEPGFTKYTFKLDPTANPPSFDLTSADGKGEIQGGSFGSMLAMPSTQE